MRTWILPAAVGLFGLSLLYFLLQFEWVQHLFGIRPPSQQSAASVPLSQLKNEIAESFNPIATATAGNSQSWGRFNLGNPMHNPAFVAFLEACRTQR